VERRAVIATFTERAARRLERRAVIAVVRSPLSPNERHDAASRRDRRGQIATFTERAPRRLERRAMGKPSERSYAWSVAP